MTHDRETSAGRSRPVLASGIGWAVLAVLLLLIIGWLEMTGPAPLTGVDGIDFPFGPASSTGGAY